MTDLSRDAEKDVRVKTTSIIWGLATGMMGISVPLTFLSHSGATIPIGVLIAAAIATKSVWAGGSRHAVIPTVPIGAPQPIEASHAAQNRIRELEERLANLEAITNFEHKLLDKKYPGAAPATSVAAVPVAPAFSFETPVSPPMPVDSSSGTSEAARVGAQPIAS